MAKISTLCYWSVSCSCVGATGVLLRNRTRPHVGLSTPPSTTSMLGVKSEIVFAWQKGWVE